MANITTSPNLWPGQYVAGINTAAVLGSDTVKSGLWRIEEGIADKAIVKIQTYTSRLSVGDLCNATKGSSVALADLAIPLTSFKIADQICKNTLNTTNYAEMNGVGAWNRTIPDEVIQSILMDMAMNELANIEKIRWSGDVGGSGTYALQDGIIVKIKASGTYNQVTPTSATASRTAATVIAEINKVLAAVAPAVRYQPGFKLVVSPEVFAAYEAAMAANQATAMYALFGQNAIADVQNAKPAFVGYFVGTTVPMYMATGLASINPEVILAGVFENSMAGNLIYATDALTDYSQILVQDRQQIFANEPFIDFTWVFRQGMIAARYNEIYLYHN